ncbi:hypothetical protein [Streptomyces rimosus]|uniref:hypothetical protein n=1 Tax=Streptomyces rimosus TaxID=1927 RepID=UPI0004C6F84D|nr:hypothetical protein [Streptomyces rimosus]
MPTAEYEYKAAHKRVVTAKGPASHKACAFCGTFAAEWAYNHQDPAEVYRDGYLWSESTAYYLPLCKRDHRAYDRAFRQHGKAVLPAVADTLTEAGQQRYDEEHRQAVAASTFHSWRVRETALGNITPEQSAALAETSGEHHTPRATALI